MYRDIMRMEKDSRRGCMRPLVLVQAVRYNQEKLIWEASHEKGDSLCGHRGWCNRGAAHRGICPGGNIRRFVECVVHRVDYSGGLFVVIDAPAYLYAHEFDWHH